MSFAPNHSLLATISRVFPDISGFTIYAFLKSAKPRRSLPPLMASKAFATGIIGSTANACSNVRSMKSSPQAGLSFLSASHGPTKPGSAAGMAPLRAVNISSALAKRRSGDFSSAFMTTPSSSGG